MTKYDALTLELERCEALARLLTDRLSDLSSELSTGEPQQAELYALSIVAKHLLDKHGLVSECAQEIWCGDTGLPAPSGGVR